jgi:hypothetical protein
VLLERGYSKKELDEKLDNLWANAADIKETDFGKKYKRECVENKGEAVILYFIFVVVVGVIDSLRYTYISEDVFLMSPILILIGIGLLFRKD